MVKRQMPMYQARSIIHGLGYICVEWRQRLFEIDESKDFCEWLAELPNSQAGTAYCWLSARLSVAGLLNYPRFLHADGHWYRHADETNNREFTRRWRQALSTELIVACFLEYEERLYRLSHGQSIVAGKWYTE